MSIRRSVGRSARLDRARVCFLFPPSLATLRQSLKGNRRIIRKGSGDFCLTASARFVKADLPTELFTRNRSRRASTRIPKRGLPSRRRFRRACRVEEGSASDSRFALSLFRFSSSRRVDRMRRTEVAPVARCLKSKLFLASATSSRACCNDILLASISNIIGISVNVSRSPVTLISRLGLAVIPRRRIPRPFESHDAACQSAFVLSHSRASDNRST